LAMRLRGIGRDIVWLRRAMTDAVSGDERGPAVRSPPNDAGRRRHVVGDESSRSPALRVLRARSRSVLGSGWQSRMTRRGRNDLRFAMGLRMSGFSDERELRRAARGLIDLLSPASGATRSRRPRRRTRGLLPAGTVFDRKQAWHWAISTLFTVAPADRRESPAPETRSDGPHAGRPLRAAGDARSPACRRSVGDIDEGSIGYGRPEVHSTCLPGRAFGARPRTAPRPAARSRAAPPSSLSPRFAGSANLATVWGRTTAMPSATSRSKLRLVAHAPTSRGFIAGREKDGLVGGEQQRRGR